MTAVSDRLDAIQARAETSADGNFIERARRERAVIHEDVPYLLDLARKQQAALDVAEWKLKALAEWSEAMIDQSYYPQYGRDVKTILGFTEAEIAEQELADEFDRNDHQ